MHNEKYGRIKVVDTELEEIRAPYVTLSHCWGKRTFIALTRLNILELTTSGIDWDDPGLPLHFKHAMITARKFDISYIWIDSLCIIQGDKEDWDKEAVKMYKYYRYAYFNISAGDFGGNIEGLFRDRVLRKGESGTKSPVILPKLCFRHQENTMFGSHTWRAVSDSFWDGELLSNNLYRRAWVFQGMLLHMPGQKVPIAVSLP